jgi:hypothetical protein
MRIAIRQSILFRDVGTTVICSLTRGYEIARNAVAHELRSGYRFTHVCASRLFPVNFPRSGPGPALRGDE